MTQPKNPFRYFDSSPKVIRLVVMMYVRYPVSLGSIKDLLAQRGIDICHETGRLWWNRFGRIFAAEIRKEIHRAPPAKFPAKAADRGSYHRDDISFTSAFFLNW